MSPFPRARWSAVRVWLLLTVALIATAPFREALQTRLASNVLYRNLSPFVWFLDGQDVSATYVPTPIKSIQQVSIAVSGTTNTATISSIVTGSSLLVYQGHTSTDAGGALNFDDFGYGTITNATTITAAKQGSGASGAIIWRGVVVEYLQNFTRSQGCSTIAIADGSTSNTATIASVTTSKTVVAFTGASNANATNTALLTEILPVASLTNATTITAARNSTAAAGTSLLAGYCYLEFR